MLKTIIFDFDGTLADTGRIMIECMNDLAKQENRPLLEATKALRERTAYQIFTQDLGVSIYKVPSYVKRARQIMKTKVSSIRLFEGVPDIVEALSKQFHLGILTSNSEEIVRNVLDRENIKSFRFIFSNSSVFGKHRSLKKLLKTNHLQATEAIYVGDEVRDIEACRKAKVPIIAVTWGFNSKKILQQARPDFIAERPKDIIKSINALKG